MMIILDRPFLINLVLFWKGKYGWIGKQRSQKKQSKPATDPIVSYVIKMILNFNENFHLVTAIISYYNCLRTLVTRLISEWMTKHVR